MPAGLIFNAFIHKCVYDIGNESDGIWEHGFNILRIFLLGAMPSDVVEAAPQGAGEGHWT